MAIIRFDGDERRKAIVAAAVPLFARKGFAGTTTKELAEAAGISEALLFRHFPSKKHLYGEILRLGCEGDPALERLAALAAVDRDPRPYDPFHGAVFFARRAGSTGPNSTPVCASSSTAFSRMANMRASCSTRSSSGFIRCLLLRSRRPLRPAISSLEPIASANRFWFGHHVAAMVAFVLLPGRASIAYRARSTAWSRRRAGSFCAASG